MLKLARSSLADKCIFHSNNGDIKWSYLSFLHDFQNGLGFKFVNKLTTQHMNFRNLVIQLMEQIPTSAAADAIEYLYQKDELTFLNSEATDCFIREIDRLFNMFHSRIPFLKLCKSPIHLGNINTKMCIQ